MHLFPISLSLLCLLAQLPSPSMSWKFLVFALIENTGEGEGLRRGEFIFEVFKPRDEPLATDQDVHANILALVFEVLISVRRDIETANGVI